MRVLIEHVQPQIDGGRFPIKRTPGEPVTVTADVFADGHDVIAAVVRHRRLPAGGAAHLHAEEGGLLHADEPGWHETPMAPLGNDAFTATFTPDTVGWFEYGVAAWVDRFASWHHDLVAKFDAGQDVTSELLEGAALVRAAAGRARGRRNVPADRIGWLDAQADALEAHAPAEERVALAGTPELHRLMEGLADRGHAAVSRVLRVWVDRARARFGAWYEMFPRSVGSTPTRSGTFAQAESRLPAIAAMGFDVLYLPPIHPIGSSFRKGRNNRLRAEPGDPGSPWAIGSEAGGHTAVEPGLGTLDDFDRFREAAERAGLEVALDLAYQCSPDHPWVREHPEWFRHRPDGTIKYAENPPKKYQDIYPLDFECRDWRALWQALRDVVLFWVGHGVRIFRVDNPHTKTFGFWEWMIHEVRAAHPDAIFLAEAFTRPKPMRRLAKAGFSQSYTYFTWRNTAAELQDYFTELTQTEAREYLRP
ncbi:MAG: DUF3416 domain-containing protein, partial [Acidobacteriota bacterium]|nr:DUF3416 domain-containing protein [Acidobacteriota bacterium]